MEDLFVFIRALEARQQLSGQRLWGSAPNPGVLSNWGEWLRGKCPFPGARFPSWEPIAPSGLLRLLSSRALSVPAVSRTGKKGCEDGDARMEEESAIRCSVPLLLSLIPSTFAQLATSISCDEMNPHGGWKRWNRVVVDARLESRSWKSAQAPGKSPIFPWRNHRCWHCRLRQSSMEH